MATTKKTPEEIEEILQLQETVAIGTKFAIKYITIGVSCDFNSTFIT